MKEIMNGTYVEKMENEDKLVEFTFYTDLNAYDKLVFVNSVIETLVTEERYNSILRDLIFDFNIITIFTDVDVSFVKDSTNHIISIEEFLNRTNIVEIIKSNVSEDLISELNKAVDDGIAYKTGIHHSPFSNLGNALTSLVKTFESKFKDINIESLMDMAEIFSGITGDITPKSVVSAYMDSDIFKENVNDIEKSKEKTKLAEVADSIDNIVKKDNHGKVIGLNDKK